MKANNTDLYDSSICKRCLFECDMVKDSTRSMNKV